MNSDKSDPLPDGASTPGGLNDAPGPFAPDEHVAAAPAQGWYANMVDILKLPAGFWIVNAAYAIDGFGYFGVLVLLAPFFSKLGVADSYVTWITAVFAAAVSLTMFGIGTYSERFGVRKALLLGMVIITLGRVLLPASVWTPSLTAAVVVGILALLITAVGEGVLQAANFSGCKQYSDDRRSSAAFGLNYSLFNVGVMIVGFASPPIRLAVDKALALRQKGGVPTGWAGWLAAHTSSGIEAVFWVCAAATALGALGCLFFTRRTEANKLRPEDVKDIIARQKADAKEGFWQQLKTGPFGDLKFTLFIFILYPARSMFAYQIHVQSIYIMRAYPQSVSDYTEYFTNVINPLIVIVGAPLLNVLTRKVEMYRLMIIGTGVTVLPTFLLCFGERWELLTAYMVIFSIGEAIWWPRLYQFAAEIAPPGRVSAYSAAANLPWLLAKVITGFYSGWFIARFCPEVGPKNPGMMWAIFGIFGLLSPVLLHVLGPWLRPALREKDSASALVKA